MIGQVAYKFNDQMNLAFNFSVGPENGAFPADGSKHDSGHYRVMIDPILYYRVPRL